MLLQHRPSVLLQCARARLWPADTCLKFYQVFADIFYAAERESCRNVKWIFFSSRTAHAQADVCTSWRLVEGLKFVHESDEREYSSKSSLTNLNENSRVQFNSVALSIANCQDISIELDEATNRNTNIIKPTLLEYMK